MVSPRLSANLPLFIGIAVPILFIAVIAAVAIVPSWFVNPKHDFVYTLQGYDYTRLYRNTYEVSGGRLSKVAVEESAVRPGSGQIVEDAPKLYRYSVADDAVHEIRFEEAQAFALDPGPTSPDGYLVEYRSGYYSFFLFGGGREDSGMYITKGGAGRAIRGVAGGPYYYSNSFRLIGWVVR